MLQPSPVPAISFVERLRTEAGPRALGISLAFLIEGLLLLLLFSFGPAEPPGSKEKGITLLSLPAEAVSEKAAEPDSPEPEQQTEERPLPRKPEIEQPPAPVVPKVPSTVQAPPPPPPAPPAATPPNTSRAPPKPRPMYGPPNTGGSRSRDTERVGTAPNGEPLYAAAWYREPEDKMLGDYLSTARGPGWGLIACRTASGFRVVDCVGIDEYPRGSQIMRSVLAAAWEFRVRPPQRGGVPLVGAWVRIRIDYSIRRN